MLELLQHFRLDARPDSTSCWSRISSSGFSCSSRGRAPSRCCSAWRAAGGLRRLPGRRAVHSQLAARQLPLLYHPGDRRHLPKRYPPSPDAHGAQPFFADQSFREEDKAIDEFGQGLHLPAGRRYGALLVIERETGINDFLEVGTELDAKLTATCSAPSFTRSRRSRRRDHHPARRLTRAGCFLP